MKTSSYMALRESGRKIDPVILKLVGVELKDCHVSLFCYNFLQVETWKAFTGKFKSQTFKRRQNTGSITGLAEG